MLEGAIRKMKSRPSTDSSDTFPEQRPERRVARNVALHTGPVSRPKPPLADPTGTLVCRRAPAPAVRR